MAGKILLARDRTVPRAPLREAQQMGVAVPGGAEIACSLARCASRRPGATSVKVDFANAFNSVHRGAMLEELARTMPGWSAFAEAAYGASSWLFCGPHCLLSAGGVQQGDVLGPAIFVLLLRAVLAQAHLLAPSPEVLEVWFLDDGFLSGPPDDVAAFLAVAEPLWAAVGLRLNRAKCEQFGVQVVPGVPLVPDDAFVLLGVPCGPRTAALAWADDVAARIAARVAALAALPEPHIALVLLRCCGAFPMANFALRAVGASPAWPALDVALRSATEMVVGPLPDTSWSLATLPLSRGGLGLRTAEPFATLALAAACCAAAPCVRTWWPALGPDPSLAFVTPMLVTPASLCAPLEAALQVWSDPLPEGREPTFPRLQKQWSDLVVTSLTSSATAKLDPVARRVNAAHAAPASAGWLCPAPVPVASYLKLDWFSPAETLALVRRRLCLEACSGPPDAKCPLCNRIALSDDHLLSCLSLGLRKRLSDLVVDAFAAVVRGGGSAVSKEPTCFPTAPTKRADLLFRMSGPTPYAIDVAITHAQLGSPDRYCPIKTNVYGPLAKAAGINFVPIVFDTAGGISTEGLTLLRMAATRWGKRYDVHPGHAVQLALSSINRVLMRGIAAILLRGLVSPSPTASG